MEILVIQLYSNKSLIWPVENQVIKADRVAGSLKALKIRNKR